MLTDTVIRFDELSSFVHAHSIGGIFRWHLVARTRSIDIIHDAAPFEWQIKTAEFYRVNRGSNVISLCIFNAFHEIKMEIACFLHRFKCCDLHTMAKPKHIFHTDHHLEADNKCIRMHYNASIVSSIFACTLLYRVRAFLSHYAQNRNRIHI